jgi:hypothetical protein
MPMRTKYDDLWFCADCLIVAENGYADDITDERQDDIRNGLARWGAHLVPDFDSETGDGIHEFSARPCDCCGSRLAGERHRYAVLEPVPDTPEASNTPEYSAPPVCDDCGQAIVRPADSCGTGYATTRDGRVVCYPCADTRERKALTDLEPGQPFGAYLSGDGRAVTTWTGGLLATVTRLAGHRTGFHRSEIVYVRAVTLDGKRLHGRGAGRGMLLTIRACK